MLSAESDRKALRLAEGGRHPGPIIVAGSPAPACESRHNGRRRNLANRAIARIGHKKISRAIECDPRREVETRFGADAIVSPGLARFPRKDSAARRCRR